MVKDEVGGNGVHQSPIVTWDEMRLYAVQISLKDWLRSVDCLSLASKPEIFFPMLHLFSSVVRQEQHSKRGTSLGEHLPASHLHHSLSIYITRLHSPILQSGKGHFREIRERWAEAEHRAVRRLG